MKKEAKIYRMVTDKHICPFGLKSLDLLKREGYQVEDHKFDSKVETDKFREQHNVQTTPQTFINGKRVGGYEDLLKYFNKQKKSTSENKTYTPIIAVFLVTFGLALALSWMLQKSLLPLTIFEFFIPISMAVLAILKLRDLEAFSNQFITYDLIGMRWIRYAYIYPFVEAVAAIGMVAKFGLIIVCPLALFIGTVGAVSVIKAVYVDKRDLKCACVGGNSNVPLGFISLTENLMMIFMSIWMLSTAM